MKRRTCIIITLLAWVIPFLVIGTMVSLRPLKRTVTPLYHEAATNWWGQKGLYEGPSGMNYMPQFAILFGPFHALPSPLGDVLWRGVTMGLLAFGSWRLVRHHHVENPHAMYLGLSALMLPICLGAVRNGQANGMFGALCLCSIACLSERRWWCASVLMGLATMVKPLGIVLLLLAPAVYPAMLWPVTVSILSCMLFPFLFGAPQYVLSQYQAFGKNLGACAEVAENRFADINGVIRALGWEVPQMASKLLRAGAGAVFLGLCYLGGRRAPEPVRHLWLYALATTYLMLFNPMTEHNSYVIVAPALGLWTLLLVSAPGTRLLGWGFAALMASMGLLPTLVRPWLGNHFGLVWNPLVMIVFLGLLFRPVWQAGTDSPAIQNKTQNDLL